MAIVVRNLKGCSSKNLVSKPGSTEQHFAVSNLPPGNELTALLIFRGFLIKCSENLKIYS